MNTLEHMSEEERMEKFCNLLIDIAEEKITWLKVHDPKELKRIAKNGAKIRKQWKKENKL